MSFVENLDESSLNKDDLFHSTEGIVINSEVNDTFSPESHNSFSNTSDTTAADLECSITGMSSSHQVSTDETAIETDNKTIPSDCLETCMLNFDIPTLTGPSNLHANLSSSLTSPSSLLYSDQTINELWSPHYEYTQCNMAVNDYSYMHK